MKKLSQIVDLKKIKVVNKNIDKAHGLPNVVWICCNFSDVLMAWNCVLHVTSTSFTSFWNAETVKWDVINLIFKG